MTLRCVDAYLHTYTRVSTATMACDRRPNKVFILFDQPVALSYLTLYNYAKTPARGVQELELYVQHCSIARTV